MTPHDAMEITRAGLVLSLTIAGPLLFTGLIVGVVISLFQALTQVQEQTLTFVPKLMGMGVVLMLCLPMIGAAMSDFALQISDRIVHG